MRTLDQIVDDIMATPRVRGSRGSAAESGLDVAERLEAQLTAPMPPILERLKGRWRVAAQDELGEAVEFALANLQIGVQDIDARDMRDFGPDIDMLQDRLMWVMALSYTMQARSFAHDLSAARYWVRQAMELQAKLTDVMASDAAFLANVRTDEAILRSQAWGRQKLAFLDGVSEFVKGPVFDFAESVGGGIAQVGAAAFPWGVLAIVAVGAVGAYLVFRR